MSNQRIPGFCALCRSRCGCISVVEDGRLVAVEPDPGHPTGKNLCVDTAVADPISGTIPLRSYLCEVRKAGSGSGLIN